MLLLGKMTVAPVASWPNHLLLLEVEGAILCKSKHLRNEALEICAAWGRCLELYLPFIEAHLPAPTVHRWMP